MKKPAYTREDTGKLEMASGRTYRGIRHGKTWKGVTLLRPERVYEKAERRARKEMKRQMKKEGGQSDGMV